MTEQQPAEVQEAPAQSQVDEQPQGDPASPEGTKTYDEDYVKQLRKEAAGYRTRLQSLEKAQKQREDAEKSELEKANEELDALRQANEAKTARIRRSNFIENIGVPNARWAWAAAQDAGLEVEFSDDDTPVNIEKVRKELVKLDPQLFGAGKADAGDKSKAPVNGDNPASSLAGILFGN